MRRAAAGAAGKWRLRRDRDSIAAQRRWMRRAGVWAPKKLKRTDAHSIEARKNSIHRRSASKEDSQEQVRSPGWGLDGDWACGRPPQLSRIELLGPADTGRRTTPSRKMRTFQEPSPGRTKWEPAGGGLCTFEGSCYSGRFSEREQRPRSYPLKWSPRSRRDTLAEIRDTIIHFLPINDTPTTNIVTLWETFKAVVRGQFISIAARQNAVRRNNRQQLEDDIRALDVTHRQTGSLAVRRQLTTQRKQLWALDKDKVEYALLRTKQKFYAGGNRAGRLLAHRLHKQAAERQVAELRLPDGTLTCQEELIRQQFELFRPIFHRGDRPYGCGGLFGLCACGSTSTRGQCHFGERYCTHRSPREHTPAAAR
ncbi:hypothetical protein NDU88_008170 [Pleurodeles waltl]|uniref:Uncharacterized protein n=1 Tax=Pleurodeles waltl TaxID=8319 RepID=A0AAV7SUW6_PLEWA|nr:hypothetical protein NDU88_008170 [Pleurodeles waltl]